MRSIVFHTPRGGVGTTTLAWHLAQHAARRGVRTCAVSMDFTGHMIRFARQEMTLRIDHRWEAEPNLSVVYSPEEWTDIPALSAQPPELLVIDRKSTERKPLPFAPDVWLAVVSDALSLRNLAQGRFPRPTPTHGAYLSLNRSSFSSRIEPEAERFLGEHPEMKRHKVILPDSGAVHSAGEEYKTVWDSAYSRTASARRLRAWADWTLGLIFPDIERAAPHVHGAASQHSAEGTSSDAADAGSSQERGG